MAESACSVASTILIPKSTSSAKFRGKKYRGVGLWACIYTVTCAKSGTLQQKIRLFWSFFFTCRESRYKTAFREDLMLSKLNVCGLKEILLHKEGSEMPQGNLSLLTSACCALTIAWQAISKQLLGKGQCWEAEYQSDSTSRPTSSATSRRTVSSTFSPTSNQS